MDRGLLTRQCIISSSKWEVFYRPKRISIYEIGRDWTIEEEEESSINVRVIVREMVRQEWKVFWA